jgi:Fic family protein
LDASKFTEHKTGLLIQIHVPQKEWSFVPNALPPTWAFPGALWPLLADARECLGTLNGIGRSLPDPQLLLKPFQRREALRSSSLEGTYATPEQIMLFELNPRQPTSDTDPANAWLEVSNYGKALRHGCKLLEKLPLSLRVIRKMHELLLTGVHGRSKSPGEFRKYQVQIGSDRRYMPPPPEHVEPCLDAFEKYLNTDDQSYDPLVRSYIVHYQFEAIHPFLDGNGRVGRVLLALMIHKWCGHYLPWLYMSSFFEKHKDEYIGRLFEISTKGDWSGWIEFCLRGTISQAKDSIRRCDLLRRLRDEFQEKVLRPTARTHRIIEGLFSRPIVTTPQLAYQCHVTYPTAKADIDRLVEAGILTEVPDVYPTAYCAGRIMDVAYSDETEDSPTDKKQD